MIAFPAGTKVWIAGGVTDMRRGMNTLALTVQQGLGRDPHAGEIFCFRGRKGDLVKLLWHVKWSCFSGQFCGLAKVHLVSVHAAFRVSAWPKYAMSGVLLSRAV